LFFKSAAERRYYRVKKWTRNVNIFNKDFLVIPINKNVHWYLAIVCFPYLTEPIYEENNLNQQQQQKQQAGADETENDKVTTCNGKRSEQLALKAQAEQKTNDTKKTKSRSDADYSKDSDDDEADEADSDDSVPFDDFSNTEEEERVCLKM
jgi:hypothetical protein